MWNNASELTRKNFGGITETDIILWGTIIDSKKILWVQLKMTTYVEGSNNIFRTKNSTRVTYLL